MELDDGFNADNPYHSVALIYAGFMCDNCGEYSSGAPDGLELQTPYRLMAEAVQKAGWRVRDRNPRRYDYSVLCPTCAGREPREAIQQTPAHNGFLNRLKLLWRR